MELTLEREALTINETILHINTEQAVETDVLLADYYPDIARVLRCHVETAAEQSVISGERLIVDGTAVCHVHYKAEDGGLANITVKIPYSKTVELKKAPVHPMVYVTAAPGYFSCRVVNPRRIDLRGAVVLNCQVLSSGEQQVLRHAEGSGMQCRTQELECGELLQWTQRSFMVRQNEELGEELPPIRRVLKCCAIPGPTEFKVVGGKIIAKAEAEVSVLYCALDGGMHRTCIRVPISEILDADGLDEQCICTVTFSVGWVDVQPKPTADDETPTVSIELCVLACIGVARSRSCTVMPDCYSTRYQIQQEARPCKVTKVLPAMQEHIELAERMELPEEVTRVEELWADVIECGAVVEQGMLRLSGRLQVCMFATLSGGDVEYYDQMQEFSKELPVEQWGEWSEVMACCTIHRLEYQQSGGAVSLSCDICMDLLLLWGKRVQLITNVTLDEGQPIEQRNNGCLTLYFPQQGEQVWDIAKRYCTSPQMILEENGLGEDGPISCKMLRIPVVQ